MDMRQQVETLRQIKKAKQVLSTQRLYNSLNKKTKGFRKRRKAITKRLV